MKPEVQRIELPDGQVVEIEAKEKKGGWETAGTHQRVYVSVAEVKSSSGRGHYEIKMDEQGKYSCGCPRWIYNAEIDDDGNRTCKHVRAYLLSQEGKGGADDLLGLESVQKRLKAFLDTLDERNLEVTVRKIRSIIS